MITPILGLALGAALSADTGPATPLERLDPSALEARLAGDLEAVRIYRDGLERVTQVMDSRKDLFPVNKLAQARVLARDEREAVGSLWKSFLDYLLALDSLDKYTRGFSRLKGRSREASFQVSRAAFLAGYRFSLDFIERAERDPGLDVFLDEPVAEIGLPKGTYSRLKFRFLNVARAAEFATFETLAKTMGHGPSEPVGKGIETDRSVIWNAGRGRGPGLTMKNAFQVVGKAGFAAWFPVQAGVAEWMGDTKVWRVGRSLVTEAQIHGLLGRLEPGDILLERREWYLSNVGLPGYWPHAAVYIGTAEERRKYFDDPLVREWVASEGEASGDFEALLKAKAPEAHALSGKAQEEGHVPRVLEAMSEGVSFTTLEHSAATDAVANLRPRLGKREKALAILRAFLYAGRPYDFNFDFRTDSALVCTELVAKAYEPSPPRGGLRFPLVEILGRPATPANEIARQFDGEFGTPNQQTDLIVFLDGDERKGRAVEADLSAFRESWKRPKWHILTGSQRATEPSK